MHCTIHALEQGKVNNIAVLRLKGRFLGKIDGPSFLSEVEALLDRGMHHFILDLEETKGIDSSAIGVFIHSLKKARQSGGDLRLASLNERIGRLLSMARLLETVFWSFPTVREALHSFSSNSAKKTLAL